MGACKMVNRAEVKTSSRTRHDAFGIGPPIKQEAKDAANGLWPQELHKCQGLMKNQ